jgi:hypothetical protein
MGDTVQFSAANVRKLILSLGCDARMKCLAC